MKHDEYVGKKVAILLPDLRPGGAERMRVNLANAFVERGVDVHMVLMQKRGALLQLLDPRVNVFELRARRPRHALLPLIRYMRQNPVDAMQASMWPLTILAVLARMLSGARCRLVAVEHTTWSAAHLARRWRTRMMIKITMRWLLPKADAVAAVSKGAAADLERFAHLRKGSVKSVYNPAARGTKDAVAALPHRFSAWANGPHNRVLAVGTLKAVKDFPTLLRAFSILAERQDARLLIVGEGEERTRLEALVHELELQHVVELAGSVTDTVPFYAHADLFVLSSTNEGFGNVIVEALERGVPVVSTDCPSGPREILEDGRYGTLVPVRDVQALADAMMKALSGPHDRQALIQRAQDFSVNKAADAYMNLLLHGKAGAQTHGS